MFKILIVLTLLVLTGTQSIEDKPDNFKEWIAFKLMHRKVYSNFFDELLHLKNYFKNKALVIKHNLNHYLHGEKVFSWKASVNKFSDMSWEEFNSVMNGLNAELKKPSKRIFELIDDFIAPKTLDYRKKGYVTEVKNQGSCGSCWAFSATGALEGQIFKANKTLISLSEQNLIDCTKEFGNKGCNGGLMDNAYKYVKYNHGIDTEKSYPYEGVDNKQCRYNVKSKGGEDSGFVDIEAKNDEALLQALVEHGPISVAVYVDENFKLYNSGVFESEGCNGRGVNHGVLLIGYGVDNSSGKKYWLVKNSWGTSWGEEGYIRISREIKNNCGISSMASFPLI